MRGTDVRQQLALSPADVAHGGVERMQETGKGVVDVRLTPETGLDVLPDHSLRGFAKANPLDNLRLGLVVQVRHLFGGDQGHLTAAERILHFPRRS
jgi:hypothetical protein